MGCTRKFEMSRSGRHVSSCKQLAPMAPWVLGGVHYLPVQTAVQGAVSVDCAV